MRILCIDGGGIRGVFPASILLKMEEAFGKPIAEMFDMIGGTSTGSIIASAIATRKNMRDILDLYQQQGPRVFKKRALGIFNSFYDNQTLKKVLQEEFGDLKLEDIDIPLMIPSANIKNGRAHVFRSTYHQSCHEDKDVRLWDAILSSCAAPLYFPPHKINHDDLTADGGLWANNPSLVCLTECLKAFDKQISEIQIVSIGTGKQTIQFDQTFYNNYWGLTRWIRLRLMPFAVTPKILDLTLHLTSESITDQCQALLNDQFLRINADLDKEITIDDLSHVDELLQLAHTTFEEQYERLSQFLV